jgi:hypothetical protein
MQWVETNPSNICIFLRTSVFSLRTSILSLPDGTKLTAFTYVARMLDGLVSSQPRTDPWERKGLRSQKWTFLN